MKTTRLVLIIAVLGLAACATDEAEKQLCDYILTEIDFTKDEHWVPRNTPPEHVDTSPSEIVPEQALGLAYTREDFDLLWYENNQGDVGVCVLHAPKNCAMAFAAYRNGEQYEIQIRNCDL